MTAEIALINRTAVTLAADSAMTLSGGNTDKIYNTADKIFELSAKDPIGVMIYNNLDFMGVPLDVIIKLFRDSQKCIDFDVVDLAGDAFFAFLQQDIGAPEEAQARRVHRQCAALFSYIRKTFDERIEKVILSHPKRLPKGFNPTPIFIECVNSFLLPFRKKDVAQGFEAISPEAFLERYQDAIDAAIEDTWENGWLEDSDRDILRELGVSLFLRDVVTPSHTGIVIAGYGKKDTFPKILAFELDGIVADRLKCRKRQTVEIDRVNQTAEIVPFAQHDMADRFLYGIDPDVESDIAEYLENTLRQTGKSIIGDLPRSRSKKALTEKLERAIAVAVREFKVSGLKEIKEDNKKLIQDMVSFMPKQELANFAESLINITSIKRKVSAEQETVGGPIDVAVISRSDGFVWVKRKHYFDPSLNPRFFFRKYGMLIPSTTGS